MEDKDKKSVDVDKIQKPDVEFAEEIISSKFREFYESKL